MDITTDEYRENARKIISFAREKLRATNPSAPELRRLLIEGRLRKNFREHLCSELDMRAHRYNMVSDEIFDEYFRDYRDIGYFSSAVVGSQILHKPIAPPPQYVGDPELYTGLSKWVQEGKLGREAAVEFLWANVSTVISGDGSAGDNLIGKDPPMIKKSLGECPPEEFNRVTYPTKGNFGEVSVASTVSDHINKNHADKEPSKSTLSENSEQENENPVKTNKIDDKEEMNSKELTGDSGKRKITEASTSITDNVKHEDKSGATDSNITANPPDSSHQPIAEVVRLKSSFTQKQTTSSPGTVLEKNKPVEMGKNAPSGPKETVHGARTANLNQNDVKNANSECMIISKTNLNSTLEVKKGAGRPVAKEPVSGLDNALGHGGPEGSSLLSSSKHQLYGDPRVLEPTKSVAHRRETYQKVLEPCSGRKVVNPFSTRSKFSSQPQLAFQGPNNKTLVDASNTGTGSKSNSKDVLNTRVVQPLAQMDNLGRKPRGDLPSQNLNTTTPLQSIRTSQNSHMSIGNVVSPPKNQKFIFRPPFPPDPMFSSISFGNSGNPLRLNMFLQPHPPYNSTKQQSGMVQTNQQNAGLLNTSTKTFGQKRKLAFLNEGSTELNTTGSPNTQKSSYPYPLSQPHGWTREAIKQYSPKHQIVSKGITKGHTSSSRGSGLRAAGYENHEGARKQRKLPKSLKKITNIVEKYDLDQ